LITLLVFVDAGEDSIMADDVVTPIEEEELKEPPLDLNVSQWSCDEEPFERVVRIQINRLT
jgi:hypothetical protein